MHFMAFYATTPLFRLSQHDSRRGSFDPHDPPGFAPDTAKTAIEQKYT